MSKNRRANLFQPMRAYQRNFIQQQAYKPALGIEPQGQDPTRHYINQVFMKQPKNADPQRDKQSGFQQLQRSNNFHPSVVSGNGGAAGG